MKNSLRHEKPPIHKTRREAPMSKCALDRYNLKETIKDQGVSSAATNSTAIDDPRNAKRNSAIDVRRELYEEIHAKMQFLEEDTRLMKEAILDCVEDRAMLVSEISHMLHMTREHLSINSECKLDGPPRVCSSDPHKDGRKDIGLLGVLHQDLTPTLVSFRPKKINVGAHSTTSLSCLNMQVSSLKNRR